MSNQIVPPALKIWLGFLFAFLLLGYDIILSILFGAIAGFAGGLIATWWITPGGEPKEKEVELPAPIRRFSRQLRQTPARLPLKGFFRRTESRYPGPRRR